MGRNQFRYVTAQGLVGTMGSGKAVRKKDKKERVVEWLSMEEISTHTHWALGSLGSASSGCQRDAVAEMPALDQSLSVISPHRIVFSMYLMEF